MEDRSLDEFLNVSDEEGGEDDDPGGGDHSGTDEGDTERASDAVDPATATATWDPGGGECVACGTTVRRRWQGEDGPVCGGCKEW